MSFIRPIRAVWFIVTDEVRCNAFLVVAQKISSCWTNLKSLSHWEKNSKRKVLFCNIFIKFEYSFSSFYRFHTIKLVILIVVQGRYLDTAPPQSHRHCSASCTDCTFKIPFNQSRADHYLSHKPKLLIKALQIFCFLYQLSFF